jgi:hypothetical protein
MRLGVFLLYWRAPRVIKKKSSENERGLAGGLVRLRARIKEHQISQANARRKSANEKTHRF